MPDEVTKKRTAKSYWQSGEGARRIVSTSPQLLGHLQTLQILSRESNATDDFDIFKYPFRSFISLLGTSKAPNSIYQSSLQAYSLQFLKIHLLMFLYFIISKIIKSSMDSSATKQNVVSWILFEKFWDKSLSYITVQCCIQSSHTNLKLLARLTVFCGYWHLAAREVRSEDSL